MWNRMGYMVVFSHLEGISNVALLLSPIAYCMHCGLQVILSIENNYLSEHNYQAYFVN